MRFTGSSANPSVCITAIESGPVEVFTTNDGTSTGGGGGGGKGGKGGKGEYAYIIKYESFFVRHSADVEDRLHLMRVTGQPVGLPVASAEAHGQAPRQQQQRRRPSIFMVHGAIENGVIFYSKRGKGY